MNRFEIIGPLAVLVFALAANVVIRYFNDWITLRRLSHYSAKSNDELIASLRLRLPRDATLVVLEHEMFFNDERNRDAAREICEKNSFEVSAAQTYEGRPKYWLLATRTALIERVSEELQRVEQFAARYGGQYARCNPRL